MWKPLNCSGSSVVGVASNFSRSRISWSQASSPNIVRAPAAMASRVHMASQSLARPWATGDVPKRPVDKRTSYSRPGSSARRRLTPGTLKSHFRPPPKALSDGARGSGATRGPFALLIRRQSRLSRSVKGILVAGFTVTTLVSSTATASAQNIFEALFGRLWNSPVTSDTDPDAPPRSPEPTRSEGGIAYCVRLCDGRYFPIQRHSGVSSAQTCSSFCPASATKIYNGNGIDHAVAPDGQRYSELGTAFAYRQKIIPDCTCNGRDAFGLVSPPVDDDPTLRPGDIVATNAGLMAYNGGPNGSTFTPISNYAGLSADLRRQLTETKIEPAAERPAPPPPVRQAQAPPARSTKNKRAQADR